MRPLLVLLLLAPALAHAGHNPTARCDTGNMQLGMIEVGTGDGTLVFYIDDRNAVTGYGSWIYQETNGIYTAGGPVDHNLQRGGGHFLLGGEEPLGYSDPCVDDPLVTPDRLVL